MQISMFAFPQIARDLIGNRRIVRRHPLKEGHSLWRVYCGDGEVFIVKRFDSEDTFQNELLALSTLQSLRLPHPLPFAYGGLTIIYRDAIGQSLDQFDDGRVRMAGHVLRQLHDAPAPKFTARDMESPTQPNLTMWQAARHGYRSNEKPVWCHGDFHPGNLIYDPGGAFLHMIDFEDFGPGDPLADLAIACVEFACHRPQEAGRIIRSLCGGYFDGPLPTDRLYAWQDHNTRKTLCQSAFAVVKDWARTNRRDDLIAWYNAGQTNTFNGLMTLFDEVAA